MNTTDEENLLKLLEIETSRISNLDSTLFTIKGWTVTLVSVLVGFAFTTSNNREFTARKDLVILAIVSTTIFMITDIAFRKVQLGHVAIATRIRRLLQEKSRASNLNTGEFNIWERVWSNEFEKKKNNRDFTQFVTDYLYTLILYSSVIVSLIYLMSNYSR
jgi:hypothetical protein